MASALTPTAPPSAPVRDADLLEAQDLFIALWGEMGTRWGVQRAMAEVHALLFIAGEPMAAEEIMTRLGISRGSASTCVRQLADWALVQCVKVRGDRREFHQAEQDVWKLFITILRARKRREFDPLVEQLASCKPSKGAGRRSDAYAQHNTRIDELLELLKVFESLSNAVSKSEKGFERAVKTLGKVLGAVGR
ncbi:MAG: MarR family transcriptional regulator [Planctomycetota bacterium]|nr:MAG: MarR family transcriptional regulator [Planctomycetota bacterium]